MNRSLRILLAMALGGLAVFGCARGDDDDDDDACEGIICRDGGPDGDADADADGDGDGDGDADGDGDGDGDVDVDVCTGAAECDNECGIVGAECTNDRQCELDLGGGQRLPLYCMNEGQYGWPGGYCAGLPSQNQPRPCAADDDQTCPEAQGGVCIEDTTNEVSYCLRKCVITDDNWDDSNCGCRPGYECALGGEYCVPGCRVDNVEEDCCRRWEDGANDQPFDGEVSQGGLELVEIEDCVATCDPVTFRCTFTGPEDAAVGTECLSDQDCPTNGRCLQQRAMSAEDDSLVWEGGYCVLDACNLDGRECPGDSNCVNAGTDDEPFWICLQACTVAPNDSEFDMYASHNPGCRDNYGCTGDSGLAGNDECEDDAGCEDGQRCIDGVCNGNGYCQTLAERLNPAIHFCADGDDEDELPDVDGQCADDPATEEVDESTFRCSDGVCQAPCDADNPCAEETICGDDGFCRWSNVGGPCTNEDGDADDNSFVSPYGQGLCAAGGIFGEDGMVLIASCDAPGMENICLEGKECMDIFGGFYCVDTCEMAAEGCEGADNCQGDAVGCAAGMSCFALTADGTDGICLASCSEQDGPDQYCADNFNQAPTCNVDTGTCG
ncbi:MAG: hypothetical protein HYY06_12930 [Deltaproteobacteria bacterium]|nr:hypothetical protein [Deltaproteobacteria bacterium]